MKIKGKIFCLLILLSLIITMIIINTVNAEDTVKLTAANDEITYNPGTEAITVNLEIPKDIVRSIFYINI